MLRSSGLITALTALAHVSSAPAQQLPHAPDTVIEQYGPRVPITSPGVLVGVRTTDDGPRLPHNRLLAFLPTAGAGDSLCVTIRSQDGRYRGDFHYALSRIGSGRVLLDVSTKRVRREVEQYPLESLAVLARIGAPCARAWEPLVVAGWVVTDRPRRLAVLALAASATHRVQSVLVAGTPRSFSCPGTGGIQERAFNRVCQVDLPDTSGEHELRLLSGPRQRPNTPLRLRLFLP